MVVSSLPLTKAEIEQTEIAATFCSATSKVGEPWPPRGTKLGGFVNNPLTSENLFFCEKLVTENVRDKFSRVGFYRCPPGNDRAAASLISAGGGIRSTSQIMAGDTAGLIGNQFMHAPLLDFDTCMSDTSPQLAVTSPEQDGIERNSYHDHALETEEDFLKSLISKKSRRNPGSKKKSTYSSSSDQQELDNESGADRSRQQKGAKKKTSPIPSSIRSPPIFRGQVRPRGGVLEPFPFKLHRMLESVEAEGMASIVSWQPHGRSFHVHKPKQFVEKIMPEYFKQTKITSFQRQLNIYGFARLIRGVDAGAYYHELFLRGKPFLCHGMVRVKVKGTGHKTSVSHETEPDFYKMPPVSLTWSNAVQHDDDRLLATDFDDSISVESFGLPADDGITDVAENLDDSAISRRTEEEEENMETDALNLLLPLTGNHFPISTEDIHSEQSVEQAPRSADPTELSLTASISTNPPVWENLVLRSEMKADRNDPYQFEQPTKGDNKVEDRTSSTDKSTMTNTVLHDSPEEFNPTLSASIYQNDNNIPAQQQLIGTNTTTTPSCSRCSSYVGEVPNMSTPDGLWFDHLACNFVVDEAKHIDFGDDINYGYLLERFID